MEKIFCFRGADIAYTVKGKGRAIVLIHGFLGSKEIWKDIQKRLSANFKVIAVDLPGHGNSDCIGYVHNIEILGASVQHLLKHLKVRKAVLAGHSLGGYVALAFAEINPDAVLGLIMINSTAKGDSQVRKNSRSKLIELVKKDRIKALKLLVPSFFNLKHRNTKRQINSYTKKALKCSERAIIATVEGMKLKKEREIVLKFAPFPYLYIAGKLDSIFNYKELEEETKLNDKGDFILIEDASHMSIQEQPEYIFKYIKAFSKNL